MANWNNHSRDSNYSAEYSEGQNSSNFTPFDQGFNDGSTQDQVFYSQAADHSVFDVSGRSFPNQVYNRSGNYTWYNPQFLGYQQQEFVPSFVCQNSSYNDCDTYEGNSSRSTTSRYDAQPGPSSENSNHIPHNHQSRSPAQNSGSSSFTSRHGSRKNQGDNASGSNTGGANRLYRNPNIYYGTTQHPHSPYRSTDSRDRGANSNAFHSSDSSKTEDRRRLLAEVATLLNQDKRQVKAANTTKLDQDNKKEKNRGWAATPNSQPQDKGAKKDYHRRMDSDRDRKWKDDRKEPENQRERLIYQLTRGKLDCLVCCERLRHTSAVWSCMNCYHVLHLHCISKWAITSTSKQMDGIRLRQETTWRCPACQHSYDSIPEKYTCFCTKYISPPWIKGETPHCCGEVCSKARKSCLHPCTLLCHPGPCPPCTAIVQRECGCGRTKQRVMCSSAVNLECEMLCSKILNCGKHDCLQKCHQGPCKPCENSLKLVCHCGRSTMEVSCGSSTQFCCDTICDKVLDCGEHKCTKSCHSGSCGTCPYDPTKFTTCHCGAKQITRKSCTDVIESCGGRCIIKRAACTHECTEICHPGKCPPCPKPVTAQCRCGHTASVQTTCHRLNTLGEKPTCKKKCSKKRSCAKHKCNQECCNDLVHTCTLPCNKTLSCGQHKCDLLCHRGNCLPCTRLGFEELRCRCGFSVIYPPIECGTRLPECHQPCSRDHDCEHEPTHSCHSLPECPPCTVLVSRTCYGGHETRKAVPCYIAEYSCGLPCGKVLPCQHKCVERCHGGDCPSVCRQPCSTPRNACSHPCALPCHKGTPCAGQSPCSTSIDISCQCQRRKQTTTCSDFRKTWFRYQASAMVASKEQVVIDPTRINTKVLECDEECKLYERNLRLAIGLQIANPDLSNKLKPQYSESMKQWAKKDPRLCDMIHHKLTQLVQLAKESKQKSRSYSFEIMSAHKRQLVHEYCKHFGVESVAYDAEPKRNVVATAYRDKCWLPSYSLLEVVQRENGQRKVPLPSLRREPQGDKSSSMSRDCGESVMLPLTKQTSRVQPSQSQSGQSNRPPSPHIDYFDFTPTYS